MTLIVAKYTFHLTGEATTKFENRNSNIPTVPFTLVFNKIGISGTATYEIPISHFVVGVIF